MLRKSFGVLIASLAMTTSASSDGLRSGYGSIKDPPSAYRSPLWDGFYIGANAGYAWSDDNGDDMEVVDGDRKWTRHWYGNRSRQGKFEAGPRDYDLGLEGGFAGAQMGFNRRAGNFVFGLEADIQTGVEGSSTTKFDPRGFSRSEYTAALDVEWFGTLRGRVGYAWNRTLLYATGGLAFGEVSYSARHLVTEPCDRGGFANLKSSGFETGYVIGGGLEHAITPKWSLKLEYQYINLGDGKAEAPMFFANGKPSKDTVKTEYDMDFHTVRVGLNYRFHREQAPLK